MKPEILRAATATDYHGICALLSEDLNHHVGLLPDRYQPVDLVITPEWLADILANPRMMLIVAETNGELVGLILLEDRVSPDDPIYVPRHWVFVDEIVVTARFRRQGLGHRLLKKAQAWAIEQGATEILLDVWEANEGAIGFYEHLGFEVLRRRFRISCQSF